MYEATGQRLLILGILLLLYLLLVSVGALLLGFRALGLLGDLSPQFGAIVCFATLAGIAAVVRSAPLLMREVARILLARGPDTAGLVGYVPEPSPIQDRMRRTSVVEIDASKETAWARPNNDIEEKTRS